MYTILKKSLLCLTLLLVMPLAYAASLTGVWQGNDGARYYLRQVGKEVWWYGENDPVFPSFSNVAHGKLDGSRAGTFMGRCA